MNKLISFLTVIYFSASIHAQLTTFSKDYNFGFGINITGNATESLTPLNYVFTGVNATFIPIRSSITEVNSVGDVVWSRTYNLSLAYQLTDIKRDQTLNQYYVCGGNETGGGVFMTVDATGTPLITKNITLTEATGVYFNSVKKTLDGGYILAGYVSGYDPDGAGPEIPFNPITYIDNDGNSQTDRIYSPIIMKLNSSGDHVWHQVTRYYTAATRNPGERIYNSASFSDVQEVSDGFIAVGGYKVNEHRSAQNADGDDATPRDAIILKVNGSGAIVYHQQIDNPNTDPTQDTKYYNSINPTSSGEPVLAGYHGSGVRIIGQRLPASGGWTGTTWSRRLGATTTFCINPSLPFTCTTSNDEIEARIFELSDGNYGILGQRVVPLSFDFAQALMKFNPSTNNFIFAKRFQASFFASFFPVGEQVSDNGFLSLSMSGNLTSGWGFTLTKYDDNGNLNSVCPTQDIDTRRENYSPTFAVPHYRAWSSNNVSSPSIVPLVTNLLPTETEICLFTACTPPAAPTTVTANPATICPGESSSITASGPSDPNVTYNVYDAATGGTNLGATPLSVSPASTTSYWVEAVDNSDPLCVSTTRTEVVVTVSDGPTTALAGDDQTICGTSTTLEGNTAAVGTGTWTVVSGSGTFADANNPTTTVSGLSAGANVFQWTIANDPCVPSSDQVTINAVETPTTALAGDDQSICSTSTTLEGNTPTIGTGTWTVISGSGTFADANNPTTTVSGLGNGANVFQWTITNAPCPASSDQVTITNTGGPTTALAGDDQTICGTSATLEGNTAAVGTGTWTVVSGSGTFADANNPTTSVSGLSAGANVFQWTIANDPCVPSSDQVTINAVETPTTALAGDDQSICSTSTTLEGNTPTIGTGTWTVISGSGTFADANNPTTTVSGLGTGANVFQWTITNTPCPASSDQVTITNTGGPTTALAGDDQTICGTSTTLEGNTAAVGTGTWTVVSGSGTFADANNPTTTVSGLSAGANVFQWTIANDPCVPSSDEVTINAVETPTAALAGDDQSICSTSTTLEGNTPAVGTGTWTVISGTGTFADENNPTTTVSGLGLGDNIFQWTITNAPCSSSSDQVTITNTGGPTISIVSTDDVSCNGGNDGEAEVTTSGGVGPYNYSWSPSGGSNATATGLTPGDYTVTVTDDIGCLDNILVTIGEPTAISLDVSSTPSSCATPDGTATVVANGGNGPYTYAWSPSGGNADVASGLASGDYTVTVTDANLCEASTSVTVGVSDGPVIAVESTVDATCNGGSNGSAEISVTGGTGNYTYSWSPSGGSAATATDLSSGDYTVTVEDEAGCIATENITIGEPDALSVTADIVNATCSGNDGSITLTVSGGTANYSYEWQPNGETTSTITGNAGSYNVTVTDANNCEITEAYTIGLTDNLQATVDPEITTIEGGESVDVVVTIDPDVDNVTYTWTPTEGLSCSDCPNPTASPSETTTYEVVVIADNGCNDTAQVTIVVTTPCGDIFMPTIFSPNADGLNDELCLLGNCITELDLKIYDRWGELVFETTDPSFCWDGSFRGKPMNSAVFVYKLLVRTTDGQEVEESGNVNLVR